MAKKRPDERGAVLVEFALVAVFVGIPMLIGGLFLFSAVIAKSQATGDTPTAANFLAAGGCPTTTTVAGPGPTTSVPCADGAAPPASCTNLTNLPPGQPGLEEQGGTYLYSASEWAAQGLPPGAAEQADVATLATVCEIDQIVGNSLFDTDGSSLQTAIYCSSPGQPNTVGVSNLPCNEASAVWACVRAWDGNSFTSIIGPLWISSNSEQIVSPVPPGPTTTTTAAATTTTAAGATTTTTANPGPQYPALDFNTFYPANTYNSTGAMTCGPPTTTTTT